MTDTPTNDMTLRLRLTSARAENLVRRFRIVELQQRNESLKLLREVDSVDIGFHTAFRAAVTHQQSTCFHGSTQGATP